MSYKNGYTNLDRLNVNQTLAIGGADISASAADLNKLAGAGAAVASGTPAEAIADLAADANGTAIAAAVNALRDALVAFGIVGEGE